MTTRTNKMPMPPSTVGSSQDRLAAVSLPRCRVMACVATDAGAPFTLTYTRSATRCSNPMDCPEPTAVEPSDTTIAPASLPPDALSGTSSVTGSSTRPGAVPPSAATPCAGTRTVFEAAPETRIHEPTSAGRADAGCTANPPWLSRVASAPYTSRSSGWFE